MFLALAFVDLPAAAVRGRGRRGRRHLPEDRLHARRDAGPGGEPGAAADRLARASTRRCGSASASAGATSCSPRWWTSGSGLGGIIITSQRRGPREHIYLVLVGDRGWWPSSPTGCGRRRALLCSRTGRSESVSALPPVVEFKDVEQDLQPGHAHAVHGAQGHQLRDRGHARATASSSPIVGPVGLRQVDDPEPDPGLLRTSTRRPTRRGAGARRAGRPAPAATAA